MGRQARTAWIVAIAAVMVAAIAVAVAVSLRSNADPSEQSGPPLAASLDTVVLRPADVPERALHETARLEPGRPFLVADGVTACTPALYPPPGVTGYGLVTSYRDAELDAKASTSVVIFRSDAWNPDVSAATLASCRASGSDERPVEVESLSFDGLPRGATAIHLRQKRTRAAGEDLNVVVIRGTERGVGIVARHEVWTADAPDPVTLRTTAVQLYVKQRQRILDAP
ncbi:hypothetical protein [Tsukamurella sp. PLM1]|uniref:hypothetical protein n=1 Tax=Tsukamurella sp. PLM1 TaxID=2929795 RepID=UPI002046CB92|nr:hypothetical protein [Tsukamurella sp. PLM1]BDH56988.1 hypothetical protein MTP03_19270 [Tsukamurella sp. PLM1]